MCDIKTQTDSKHYVFLIRVHGKLKTGRPSDIDFKRLFRELYINGAYFVMKNTSKLFSEEFEEVQIKSDTTEEIESSIIEEHAGQIKTSFPEKELTISLMTSLNTDKQDGETVSDFKNRVISEVDKLVE